MHLDNDAIDDSLDFSSPPVPWGLTVASLFGLFSYVPLGFALGLARSFPGARSYAPHALADTGLYFLLYVAAVHGLLVWPLTSLAFPQYLSRKPWLAKFLIPIVLLTLPLVSFTYFIGEIPDGLALHDVLLSVVPAVTVATFLYLRTERTWLFTLYLAIATFVPLFVLNDILSPYPVVWSYGSASSGFYFWRILLPLLTPFLVLATRINSDEPRGLALTVPLLGIATSALVLPSLSLRDAGTVIFLASSYFLWRPSRLGFWCLVAAAAGELLISVAWLGWYAVNLRLQLEEIARLTQLVCVGALAAAVLIFLSRPSVRARFYWLTQ